MLHELLENIDTLDFEENGSICVIGATWQNAKEDLELIVEVNTGGDEVAQRWSLLCRSERAHNIALGCGQRLEVVDDHILLWPQSQTICSLWFNGSGDNALTIVGELCCEHQKLVGDWFSFSHFFNGSDLSTPTEIG